MYSSTRLKLIILAASLAAASCGGNEPDNDAPALPPALTPAPPISPLTSPPVAPPVLPPVSPPILPPKPEETRLQDSRNDFVPADPNATTFAALAAGSGDTVDNATTDRWAGMLGRAAYQIEVPQNWNGMLVMYAHGYAGENNRLVVTTPSIRRYLIQSGYAWAASSYSKNFYDVRAGIEDTNALALAFTDIAKARGRTLTAPGKIYITGHSMGGHIAAAAVEDETFATANHKVRYNGAVPMCGMLGDTEWLDYIAGAQVTAQALAGLPDNPVQQWTNIAGQVKTALYSTFPTTITPLGQQFAEVIKNLTGGDRPMFNLGFTAGRSFTGPWGMFGGDGTVAGILNQSTFDTRRFIYVIDSAAAASSALNAAVLKLSAMPDANRLRTDGLRWIPRNNGEFRVPVLTLHTLGDLYAPFSMEQIYQKRVTAKGNGAWLVQRAIRGITHCDFSVAEQVEAFDAMVKWERTGIKPAGDDVVTATTVAAPLYGCTFTRWPDTEDDSSTNKATRQITAAAAPCPP
ncbi:alpha/beta hydrolase [Paraburkholderia bonniea]|uniref:alpha/beta hydrolase family protein n=1 Tax=Paraburkholderia bonniea TaxID=2152891 RepID=UPI002573142D|nr:alpha/beta hydrolase [Paraburkholderia bonniea]WJF91224.1 alpha/beta hydrolase [Paraburkholderia bonniea]WJF94539.1 alpha/beta hydrolase [Paraburkholderia bonniea]